MFGFGATELVIILLIVVIIFGARRLPEIGSGVGKAIKNFKAGISGKDEIDVTPEKDEVAEGRVVQAGRADAKPGEEYGQREQAKRHCSVFSDA